MIHEWWKQLAVAYFWNSYSVFAVVLCIADCHEQLQCCMHSYTLLHLNSCQAVVFIVQFFYWWLQHEGWCEWILHGISANNYSHGRCDWRVKRTWDAFCAVFICVRSRDVLQSTYWCNQSLHVFRKLNILTKIHLKCAYGYFVEFIL